MFQWITGSLVALGTYVPQSVQGMIYSVFILMAVDTISGLTIARRKKQTSSAKMRRMTAEKALQFLQILGLGAAGAVAVRGWTPFGLGLAAIITIEAKSIIENLTWLEVHGGVSLGPARPILLKIADVLGLAPENAEPAADDRGEERA